jgi:uncharacterized membrane protein
MKTRCEAKAAWLEEVVDQNFTPKRLMTIVFLIIVTVALLSTSGIENRTTDGPIAEYQQTSASPLLS